MRYLPSACRDMAYRRTSYFLLLPAFLFMGLRAPAARAAEETNFFGAHLLQPQVKVTPAADSLLELNCTVPLMGGCCFPLTSHQVTASLVPPEGITVISGPEPANYPAIEAPVSGTPKAWAVFRWRLKLKTPMTTGALNITVASSDSGQVRATYRLGENTPCTVTGPLLPEIRPPGQPVPIAVDAVCLDANRFVQSVRFWYSTEIPLDAQDIEAPPDLAQQGILRFKQGGRSLMVQGQSVELARKYEPTTWYGSLPAGIPGVLQGVAVAVDDAGKTSCGSIVHCTDNVAAAAPAPVAAPGAMPSGLPRRLLGGTTVLAALVALVAFLACRRRMAVVALGIALVTVLLIPIFRTGTIPAAPAAASNAYPADSSATVYLFLDSGAASRELAKQLETYRAAAPHRIHMLSFVEGATPSTLLAPLRERYRVTIFPSVVFDGHATLASTNAMAAAGILDRCLGKPPAHLSMELHGSVMAGRALSLGFIMCNHGSSTEMRGSTASFVYENGVLLDGWHCDRVVREQAAPTRPYTIPPAKCQPPTMLKWDIPSGVDPAHVGALMLILDEQGRVIDSICTEKPCARTGVCG